MFVICLFLRKPLLFEYITPSPIMASKSHYMYMGRWPVATSPKHFYDIVNAC